MANRIARTIAMITIPTATSRKPAYSPEKAVTTATTTPVAIPAATSTTTVDTAATTLLTTTMPAAMRRRAQRCIFEGTRAYSSVEVVMRFRDLPVDPYRLRRRLRAVR
jgi:hypothetical protein